MYKVLFRKKKKEIIYNQWNILSNQKIITYNKRDNNKLHITIKQTKPIDGYRRRTTRAEHIHKYKPDVKEPPLLL